MSNDNSLRDKLAKKYDAGPAANWGNAELVETAFIAGWDAARKELDDVRAGEVHQLSISLEEMEKENNQLRVEVALLTATNMQLEIVKVDWDALQFVDWRNRFNNLMSLIEQLRIQLQKEQALSSALRDKLAKAKAALELIAGPHTDMGAVCQATARNALAELEQEKK